MASRFCFSLTLIFALCRAATGAESAEAVFQRAASALAVQDYQVAEQGFLQVLKLEPGNVGALGNLGVVYSRTRHYSQAIDTYERALKIAPGDNAISTNLGLAYIKQERYSAALPIFETLARNPSNFQARELLATCRISLHQYQPAIAVLDPLQAEEPNDPGVLYMLGVAFSGLKRTDEAHAAFAKMMAAATPAQADFLMGKASYQTGNFQQAESFFRKTIAADPHFDGAHRELGKTLISLRDNSHAEKELRLAGNNDPEALYYLGALLCQMNPAEAVKLLNRAHEMTPDFWGSMYYLGRAYLEEDKLKDALPLLSRAAQLNPAEPAIQYQLGRALKKAGRSAEAEAAFGRVKELKSKSLQAEVDILDTAPRQAVAP